MTGMAAILMGVYLIYLSSMFLHGIVTTGM